ncbi:MAG: UPF0280 family protein [Dehalococcoidales bacterium]
MYQPKTYRDWVQDKDLFSYNIVIKETDLYIRSSADLKAKALNITAKFRKELENHIKLCPEFANSLKPLKSNDSYPQIVRDMIEASAKFDVGPMAAVAGAISDYVGKELLQLTEEVIIENGGDIFLSSQKKRAVGIYAGDSPLSGVYGIEIMPQNTPLGICTSSGTVGHAFSFGKADAAVIVADSATIADAAATAVCNMVKTIGDINKALEYAKSSGLLKGAVIIKDNEMGVWGDLELCEIPAKQ